MADSSCKNTALYDGTGQKAKRGALRFTLSLPEPLLRRFRVYAASQNQSMTRLMAAAVRKMIDEDAESAKAKRRFFDRIEKAPDRGAHGAVRWPREELYER